MNCVICDSSTSYYFSKVYTEYPFGDFMRDIGKVDYYQCINCGFVMSKTHQELDVAKWKDLNYRFHQHHELEGNATGINQPPYLEQAIMIYLLGKNKIIKTDNMIDFAAGYGCLSRILSKYFDLYLPIYDPFIQTENADNYANGSRLRSYDTVINSAMFEHILTRNDLNDVNNIVSPEGCLVIHTVVCEKVPNDSNWFYLRPPVHTAFHTNKSMSILMDQWGYRSSIYSPRSKCWVLLRKNVTEIEKTIGGLNEELKSNWFFCKDGFVDYWKGF